jgi:hypothetical protein
MKFDKPRVCLDLLTHSIFFPFEQFSHMLTFGKMPHFRRKINALAGTQSRQDCTPFPEDLLFLSEKYTNHCSLHLHTVFPLNIAHGLAFFNHLLGWVSFRDWAKFRDWACFIRLFNWGLEPKKK